MSEFYYGQTIEYVDGTRDLHFEAARKWAEENNAYFLEVEPTEEGIRVFQIIGMSDEAKTDEVRQIRAELYAKEKDPITCQIQSLRDEEQTPEVVAEIEKLIAQRAEVVARIKEENPYPVVETVEEVEEPVEELVEEVENFSEESNNEVVELYSMEI